ncbi:MAG: hypothetical protein UU24_C0028G0004 [Candidatus Nomurabacteria bacterium GW2011_GWA2_40_9]|uniref:Plasmid stabilization system n=1 Tax=Candidatus Nomurabacteria bacterium GW2011_GWA2_40_9 TaxID=1618734 RepID=A0A0G0TNY4_9BACT|nr:MAG: hypothetical protein UU24_C0028G0004 [Candidatus Nomurabacteria bacterium GW2011_GWA2_40_9]
MTIKLHKNFIKQFDKLPAKNQKQAKERLKTFLINHHDPSLNNHPLKGRYLNYRSINLSSDLRAVYRYLDEDQCIFVLLGTHSALYS